MRLPQTHPCAQSLDRRRCTVVLRTVSRRKWWAKGPCPCDWAEVERDQEGMSRDRRQGKLQMESWFSLLAGWLGWRPQSASLAECGRSVAVSPSLGAARCQAGSESGQLQLQLQGTLRSRPHVVCEGSNDSDADAMLDHAISGWGCENVAGQGYPDAELRVVPIRFVTAKGWDRSPGCRACVHGVSGTRHHPREGSN